MPAIRNSRCAAAVEPCCSRLTIWFKTSGGNGTSQSRKQRGKSARRKAPAPKLAMNAPTHHATKASIFAESSASGENANDLRWRMAAVVMTAKISNEQPTGRLHFEDGSADFQSRRIKTALMGRMSRMWVYCSSRRASVNREARDAHQTATAIAPRIEKMRNGDDLKNAAFAGSLAV